MSNQTPILPVIKVLVAEHCTVTRMRLVALLESDSRLRVVAAVPDGQAALEFVTRRRPDVVLMDLHMSTMNGFEATRRIMETQPVPIVVCSAVGNIADTAAAFRAIQAGALACVDKPFGSPVADTASKSDHLLQTVKLMAEVKVVRRRRPASSAQQSARVSAVPARSGVRLIAVGASTGGPPVLQQILSRLPAGLPVPLLVVQHIAPGFLLGMVDWLAESSGPQVSIAVAGTVPQPGHAYLAPDDHHMGLGGDGRIVLSRQMPENHVRPAVSFLFRSLLETLGSQTIGVLLTGMGRDGAEELTALRRAGATTIAQDRDSSVVHGMPGLAIAMGGASHVLPGARIGDALLALLHPT